MGLIRIKIEELIPSGASISVDRMHTILKTAAPDVGFQIPTTVPANVRSIGIVFVISGYVRKSQNVIGRQTAKFGAVFSLDLALSRFGKEQLDRLAMIYEGRLGFYQGLYQVSNWGS